MRSRAAPFALDLETSASALRLAARFKSVEVSLSPIKLLIAATSSLVPLDPEVPWIKKGHNQGDEVKLARNESYLGVCEKRWRLGMYSVATASAVVGCTNRHGGSCEEEKPMVDEDAVHVYKCTVAATEGVES
jgi:hypothetical protein